MGEAEIIKGIYLVNKPAGITSHDVVSRLRRVTGEKRIGHAGTLDPFAEGLLIVAIGREYTKKIGGYVGLDKEYIAEAILGKETDTHDREGTMREVSHRQPSVEDISKVLRSFIGVQMQLPPQFSAKKVKGKKAYELARKGIVVTLEPREVSIFEMELLKYEYPRLEFRTRVSSGTYIRTLAYDLGQQLGTGAYLEKLIRTKIGSHLSSEAVNLDTIITPDDLIKGKIC